MNLYTQIIPLLTNRSRQTIPRLRGMMVHPGSRDHLFIFKYANISTQVLYNLTFKLRFTNITEAFVIPSFAFKGRKVGPFDDITLLFIVFLHKYYSSVKRTGQKRTPYKIKIPVIIMIS